MFPDYTYCIKDGDYSYCSHVMNEKFVTILLKIQDDEIINYNIYKGYDKALIGKNTMDVISDNTLYYSIVIPYDTFINVLPKETYEGKLVKDFS